MKLIKFVPLMDGLYAASRFIKDDGKTPANPDAFSVYYSESGLVRKAGLPMTELLPHMDKIPTTPMGRAWSAAVNNSISLAQADAWRPYDLAVYTDAESEARGCLDGLIDRLPKISPLLSEVADSLMRQDLGGTNFRTGEQNPFSLEDIFAQRRRISPTGVALDPDRDGEDGHGQQKFASWALWEHIEMIAPGTRTLINKVLSDLDRGIPDIETDDGAAFRAVTRQPGFDWKR